MEPNQKKKNCLQSRFNKNNLSLILELATEILDVVNRLQTSVKLYFMKPSLQTTLLFSTLISSHAFLSSIQYHFNDIIRQLPKPFVHNQ